ncbi:CotH kinase family protein [Myxococcaceae bacterium JPH2]|nr:CotH kinase family protein [Myxococcaceae bacterium JPH2]
MRSSFSPPGLPLRAVRSPALLACLGLWLSACHGSPPMVESADEGRVEQELPAVTLEGMDNARHVLWGAVRGDVGALTVEVFVDSVRLGRADVEGGQWSLPWWPDVSAREVEVVASHVSGEVGRAHVELRPLDLLDAASLYQPETLLTLPTSATTTTRYTVDGSVPTPASPLYSGPLVLLGRQGTAPLSAIPTTAPEAPDNWGWKAPQGSVSLAHVIRAQAFDGATPVGPGWTRTYLLGREPYTLPVVSLVTEAANLFGDAMGIYVPGNLHQDSPEDGSLSWNTGNYMQDGKDWERPVSVEWFEADGAPGLAQPAGVRIHGSGSAVLAQKSLRLYAKEDYGPEWFSGALFPGLNVRDFKRLLLRTSGQDQVATKLKDCVLQGLLRETALTLQACRPALVFINGEYWGLHELRERYDEYYLSGHYAVDRKKVTILEGAGGLLDVGAESDAQAYQDLLEYVRTHDLAVPASYAYVQARVDVDDFIDYLIAEIYFANTDWPDNNVRMWRYSGKLVAGAPAAQDGRWRWMVYDLDSALLTGPEDDTLTRLLSEPSLSEPSVVLPRKLMASPDFRARFAARFRWHLDHTFAPERVVAAIDAVAGQLAPEMAEHIQRWSYPASLTEWEGSLERMRDTAARRPAFMRQFLEETFGPP